MITQDDYEWLFRKAPVMTTSIAEDGRYLDVNDAMLERLGYALDEMVGHKPEDFATAESAERIVRELRPLLRRRGKLENQYIAFISASGEVVRYQRLCRV
jgi:PAS domain S-box-containing protein